MAVLQVCTVNRCTINFMMFKSEPEVQKLAGDRQLDYSMGVAATL